MGLFEVCEIIALAGSNKAERNAAKAIQELFLYLTVNPELKNLLPHEEKISKKKDKKETIPKILPRFEI